MNALEIADQLKARDIEYKFVKKLGTVVADDGFSAERGNNIYENDIGEVIAEGNPYPAGFGYLVNEFKYQWVKEVDTPEEAELIYVRGADKEDMDDLALDYVQIEGDQIGGIEGETQFFIDLR